MAAAMARSAAGTMGYAVHSAVVPLVLHEPGWIFGRNAHPTVSAHGHGGWGSTRLGCSTCWVR